VDSGAYAAYAGLLARAEALDSAASNLSNSSTTGFRAEREYFKAIVMGEESPDSQLGTGLNSFGVLGGNQVDLGQGELTSTGNALDVAIQGSGFFAVQTPQGIRYTRDGSFQRASDGSLQTSAGEPVLNGLNKPISIPPGEISIGSDGAVSVDGAVSGQIGVFNLDRQQLAPEGKNKYRNAGKAAVPVVGATLRQHYLEASNQSVIQGSMQLLLVQRQAEMMQKALTIFQGSFDKSASEDLPRV
jgi:flagellar basal-body rod protein FlgF